MRPMHNPPLHALVYVSHAAGKLDNAYLDSILVDAMALNQVAGVTGVLLFDGERFLQYMEGSEAAVSAAFLRVQRSRRHSGIRVLMRGEVAERYFSKWSMACRHTEASILQRIERGRWESRMLPQISTDRSDNDGLALLMQFWSDEG